MLTRAIDPGALLVHGGAPMRSAARANGFAKESLRKNSRERPMDAWEMAPKVIETPAVSAFEKSYF